MTSEEKEDPILELTNDLMHAEKMIQHGEATREELQTKIDGITNELNRLEGKNRARNRHQTK